MEEFGVNSPENSANVELRMNDIIISPTKMSFFIDDWQSTGRLVIIKSMDHCPYNEIFIVRQTQWTQESTSGYME